MHYQPLEAHPASSYLERRSDVDLYDPRPERITTTHVSAVVGRGKVFKIILSNGKTQNAAH